MNLEKNITFADKARIEIQAKKQQETEYKLIGSLKKIKGLTLWEFDYSNMTLKKATIVKSEAVNFETKKAIEKDKVFFNPKSYYFQNHCYRTAAKKANKIIFAAIGIKDFFKN
jgi:hypothetical protein